MKYHITQKKCKVPENTDGITPLEWCLTEIMKHKYEYNYMCPNLTKVRCRIYFDFQCPMPSQRAVLQKLKL